ncbi:MAG: hypothetical protein R2708_28210, partial [Vicinamibacterales bacterium]
MPTPFAVDPELAGIVRPGVLWWTDAVVVDRPAGLEAVIQAATAAATAAPSADGQAVRAMYRRSGL